MPTFAHILTSIPSGSQVFVYACKRFTQFDEVVESGAIAMIASPECYPIRVAIRPSVYGKTVRGGMKVVKPSGSEWEEFAAPRGGTFDIIINSVMDFNPGKKAIYSAYDKRVGPFVTAAAVRAAPSPLTDVYNRWLCEICGTELKENIKLCANCTHVDSECNHPKLGSVEPQICGNPLVTGYGACQEHLEFMGIKTKGKGLSKRTTYVVVRTKRESPTNGPDKPVVIVENDTPVVMAPKRRSKYKHSASYYKKRGLPVPAGGVSAD